MIKILDDRGTRLHEGSIAYIGPVSINVPLCYTIFVATDSQMNIVTQGCERVKVSSNIDGDELVLTDSPASFSISNSIYVYSLHFLLRSKEESKSQKEISISIDGTIVKIKLEVEFVDLDDRLNVLANNFKIYFDENWYNAFRETSSIEPMKDYSILNRKMREFLLEIFNLTGLIGSYECLANVIAFFGYTGLVSFKESWESRANGSIKLSGNTVEPISVEVQKGYKKLNHLSLVYDLNTEDGTVDSDGLLNFVDVAVDELYVKMLSLKHVLQSRFLPLNVKIVDIIGEHASVGGIDQKLWLDSNETMVIDESSKLDIFTLNILGISEGSAFIRNHKLSIRSDVYSVNDPFVALTGVSAHYKGRFMLVDKTDEELEDLEDFELMTKFFRGDVAVASLNLAFKEDSTGNTMQYWKFAVEKLMPSGAHELVYTSPELKASEFVGDHWIGFREEGVYLLVVYVFDFFGNFGEKRSEINVKVENTDVEFSLYRPFYRSETEEKFEKRLINYDTTSDTILGIDDPLVELLVPDAAYSMFDVNDRSTATRGPRSFRSDIDRVKTSFSILSIGHLKMLDLYDVPMSEMNLYYSVYFFDIFDSYGVKKCKLKLFEGHRWSEVSMNVQNVSDMISFVSSLNSMTMTSRAFSECSFSLKEMSIDGSFSNTRISLMVYMKRPSFKLEKMFFEVGDELSPISSTDSMQCHKNEITPYGILASSIRIDVFSPAVGDLTLKIGEDVKTIPNFDASSPSVLKAALLTLTDDVFEHSGKIAVFSKTESITVSHPSIGVNYDPKRIGFIEKMYKSRTGSGFRLATAAYGIIDEDVRFDLADIEWNLYDSSTSRKIFSTSNKVFRHLMLRYGVFDLELIVTDRLTGKKLSKRKNGAFYVG